jgi:hypothetical protein
MARSNWILLLPLLAVVGCFTEESSTLLVPQNPFSSGSIAPARMLTSYSPASLQIATRVETVSRKLLEANRETGLRPQFRTIGAPQPEIFHVGTREVNISEGLVNQCKTEGELAAVLARELGKMLSEREVQAGLRGRGTERPPPEEVRIGNDAISGHSPDLTHLAELGKYGKDRQSVKSPPPAPPDPQGLARNLLTKAGYSDKDLDDVAPVLQGAAVNSVLEKQLRGSGPSRP